MKLNTLSRVKDQARFLVLVEEPGTEGMTVIYAGDSERDAVSMAVTYQAIMVETKRFLDMTPDDGE